MLPSSPTKKTPEWFLWDSKTAEIAPPTLQAWNEDPSWAQQPLSVFK